MFKIDFKNSAKKALSKLDHQTKLKISEAIETLKYIPTPIGSKKIKNVANETHRIRCGKYRVVYQIHGDKLVILIIRVGLRKDVYRNLKD